LETSKKIGLVEIEPATEEVQSMTGWACPVDNNTPLAQPSCNLHEVFIKDKRKRMDDIKGTSKKLETCNSSKKDGINGMSKK
jgi:hypothetical protein